LTGAAIAFSAIAAPGSPPQTPAGLQPLEVVRLLAARYPREAPLGYIPALTWSGSLRLSALTGDDRWKQKVRRELEPFITGDKAVLAPPYTLAGLSGYLALLDFEAAEKTGNSAAGALARKAVDLVLPPASGEDVHLSRGWTDDMFMATALLARVSSRTEEDRYARAIGRLLTTYAGKLQRPDGLFIHALEGPHAWGRGNGFAAFGAIEALTHLPDSWKQRADVLDIYRRHMRGMLAQQSDDGAWRQIVDDPTAYRELTVTAMTVTALARGVRRGWLDRGVLPAIEQGWRAVLTRVSSDGALRDVCASTGAGATREHYLTRPIVNGHDDRGAAMAMMAALEVHELRVTTGASR
jgi:rhamnogalacturonyl hydrolase YesR